jgi:hypothetical protein
VRKEDRTFLTPARLARVPGPAAGAGLGVGVLERLPLPKILAARASFFLRSRAVALFQVGSVCSASGSGARSYIPSWIIFSKSAATLPLPLALATMVVLEVGLLGRSGRMSSRPVGERLFQM